MSRVLRRTLCYTVTAVLIGSSFLLFYLSKDSNGHKILNLPSPPVQITSNGFPWPRCERKMSANSTEGFNSFPDSLKDFLYYQHCQHFPMLLDVPDKCGGPHLSSEVFLLLVIKSPPHHHDIREMLRKTWATERLQYGVWIRRVFIVGTGGSGFEKERLNKVLELEQSHYHDILQWDFMDTFNNLTLKQVLFLEWMERNCPKVRFLFNGDEDAFAHTNNMVKYLLSLEDNDGSKHLYTGHVIHNGIPVRDPWSKYFIPVQMFASESYPPFCGGGGFLLSGFSASVIYSVSKSIPLFPVDDVYLGMCLAKAGLAPSTHMGIQNGGLPIPSSRDFFDPCFYKQLLLVHKFPSPETYLMWHRVNDPTLKCFGTV